MAFCTPPGCSHPLSHLYGNHIPAAEHLKHTWGASSSFPPHPHCPDRLLSLESSGAPLFWNTLGHFGSVQKQALTMSLNKVLPLLPLFLQGTGTTGGGQVCELPARASILIKEELSTLSFNSWICSFPNDSDSTSVQFSLFSSEFSPDWAPQSHHCLCIALSQSPNSLQRLCLRMPRQSLLYINLQATLAFSCCPPASQQLLCCFLNTKTVSAKLSFCVCSVAPYSRSKEISWWLFTTTQTCKTA